MSRESILLLGGGGFIGAALARRLASSGQSVHVVSRKPFPDAVSGINVHIADIGDTGLLKKLLPGCGTVIHLASSSTPGSSARCPSHELDNLAPTLHMLEILRDHPDTQLIFFSSGGTVYGNPAKNPVAEDAALAPLSYHGAGKVALEGFLHAFRATGHPVTILRPANAYGPGQHLDQGFGFIRTLLQHIRLGSQLEIWGDGENVRDFIYIDDVIDAVVAATGARSSSAVYNVGSGKGYTLNEVLAAAQRVCGQTVSVSYRPMRNVDVRTVVLDISSIGSGLGWRPSVDLDEGLLRTWNWLCNS